MDWFLMRYTSLRIRPDSDCFQKLKMKEHNDFQHNFRHKLFLPTKPLWRKWRSCRTLFSVYPGKEIHDTFSSRTSMFIRMCFRTGLEVRKQMWVDNWILLSRIRITFPPLISELDSRRLGSTRGRLLSSPLFKFTSILSIFKALAPEKTNSLNMYLENFKINLNLLIPGQANEIMIKGQWFHIKMQYKYNKKALQADSITSRVLGRTLTKIQVIICV